MRHTADPARLRVFLCFAGDDRPRAKQFERDLCDHGVDTFLDEQSIAAAENLVLAINRALTQADYFVLLWSRHAVDRQSVELEWTAALLRELEERRPFLFVVRLDETPMPLLLAPRKYLDAFGSLDAVAARLTANWHQPAAEHHSAEDCPTIAVCVRNRALSVAHSISVPAQATGRQLENVVRSALALPDLVTKFNGKIGMRFYYSLNSDGEPVPDEPLTALGIVDGATIDLMVQVEQFGPAGSSPRSAYRAGESKVLSPEAVRVLVNVAFGHLMVALSPDPTQHRRRGSAPGP